MDCKLCSLGLEMDQNRSVIDVSCGLSKRRRDDETRQATGHYIRVNGRGRSPERNYVWFKVCHGQEYDIGTPVY